MYNSKKEVDNHVRLAFLKIRSENDRALRGFTIAKLYFKIKEYATAEQYICTYLNVKDDNDQAHKMLGQCYQFLKQPTKALQSFQRSLQLNSKQPELLADVCQLLLDDEQMQANKAKYWCDLAESEKVENESVYALRLKLMNQSNVKSNEIESILRKDISSRPNDVNPRVRLVRHFLDQQRIVDAFKYVHEFEMQQNEAFNSNSEWYNILWLVLSKYEHLADAKKDWNFWLLVAICLERLVFISFVTNEAGSNTGNSGAAVTETANLLFRLDQYLFKISQLSDKFNVQRELVSLFLDHYRGQFVLHAVALLFKRELLQKKNKWRETLQSALPLLLLAFHVEPKENKAPWMKHCDENCAKLIQLWYREGAFRCAQAGRTLLSCINEDNKENTKFEVNSVFGSQPGGLWSNADELLAQIRQFCVDKQWRRNVFAQLYCNSDQKVKEQSSFLVKSLEFAEPIYELPTFATLESYEEVAQYLKPQSLRHIVYLGLNHDHLENVRALYFSGLNFSTSNLNFCGAESLNQLDVDSFLYAAIIESQRSLQVYREQADCFTGMNQSNACQPRILPFVNMHESLCSEEQRNWWLIAYKVYKNLTKSDNNAQMRSDLQAGIEVVRGLNGPKMEMIIVFKLGKIFAERAKHMRKSVERNFVEARTEALYMHGLKMLKMHHRGLLEPFRKTFKYSKSNSSAIERTINEIAEGAVLYISERMLKKAQFEEFIEEMSDLPLPFATYKQAEAYRKLEEASSTPKSAKQRYSERASACIQKTIALLKSSKFDDTHPLNSTIHTELKRFPKSSKKYNDTDADEYSFMTDSGNNAPHNNSSTYEDAETEFFSPALNRSQRRDVVASLLAAAQASPQQNSELESLVKQLANTLTFVKDELVDTIKPELMSIRQEVVSLKDKVAQLEDSMKKIRTSSGPPSRDDGSNVLDDFYLMEDALQNHLYPQQQGQQQTQLFPGVGANNVGSLPATSQQRIHTPNALQMQQQAAAVAAAAAYNSPMFNPNYPLSYYASPYMLAQQGAAANSLLAGRSGQMALPYMDATAAVNFNSLFPQTPNSTLNQNALTDGRTNNMFNLLSQQQPQLQATLPTLSLPSMSSLTLGGQPLTTSPLTSLTSTVASTSTITTATATAAVTSTAATTNTTPSAAAVTFNKALNNQPVEKGPPANVVITSSDPLPNPKNATQLQQQQATLSVTIPSHHIKPSLVQTNQADVGQTNGVAAPALFGNNSFGGSFNFGGISSTSAAGSNKDSTPSFINSFSFKPDVEQALAAQSAASQSQSAAATGLNESSLSDLNNTAHNSENIEYDPIPDFQPIIPLPAEIELRTGEEDEETTFCEHAKLYRFVNKEWKERGIGTLKVLKSKDGHSRILMRRDQTHKLCANHKITKDIKLSPKKEKNGYTWGAADFADGEMKSEVFFLRFKLPEQAQNFQTVFEQAQKDDEKLDMVNNTENKKQNANPISISNATSTSTSTPIQTPFDLAKSSATIFASSTPTGKPESAPNKQAATSQPPQPQPFGMSIATSTPGKTLFSGLNLNTTATTTSSTTPNPFANFSFSTLSATTATTNSTTVPAISSLSTATSATVTPFSNLFSKSPQAVTSSPFSVANLPNFGATIAKPPDGVADVSSTTAGNNPNKSNASDNEDDYVPTAQFKPVVALPELVEISTGEENYTQLFEHRAKLLRFDKDTREWKERGLGNIRVLQKKDDADDVRLVMRREQVHKLCCNQRLYKNIEFKYAKNSQVALQWIGHDYSENELQTDTLTLRFKTAEICKEFLDVITQAQQKMSDKAKLKTDGENGNEMDTSVPIPKPTDTTFNATTEVKGFGDAFKPKAGSWSCNGCYIINSADNNYCPSCDTPKDDTVPKKDPNASVLGTTKSTFAFGFGNSSQISTNTAQTIFGVSNANSNNSIGSGFTFGTTSPAPAPAPTVASTTPKVNTVNATPKPPSTGNDFGDMFKQKPGSWNCKDCYTNNSADKIHCIACEAPKDSSIPKKETKTNGDNKNILALSDPTQKFTFGFPLATATKPNEATPPQSTTSQSIFGVTSTTNAAFPPLSKSSFTFNLQSKAMTAPAMPTDTNTANAFASPFSLNKKEFTFTMAPKSSEAENGGDADNGDGDDSNLHEEEENNAYFAPVIPLPDKIDVKTGEENEEVLYQHRAKLYRFFGGEWKERGIGDVKVLRHKTTEKLRVVMRRDQVHKICLNHVLNEDVEYKSKDEKSWLFVVNDFSEGEVQLEQLSLRFKTKEIAESFMSAIKLALSGAATPIKTENKKLNGHTSNGSKLSTEPLGTNEVKTADNGTAAAEKVPEQKIRVKSQWSLVQPDLKMPIKTLAMPTITSASSSSSTISNRPFSLKASVLDTSATETSRMSLIGDKDGSTSTDTNQTSPVNFSFTAALKENDAQEKAKAVTSGGFLFSSPNTTSESSTFGGSIFSGNATQSTVFGQPSSIFKNFNANAVKDNSQLAATATTNNKENSSKPLFGQSPVIESSGGSSTSIFGGLSNKDTSKSSLLGAGMGNSIFGGNGLGNSGSVFGGAGSATQAFGGFGALTTTGNEQKLNNNNNNTQSPKPFSFADLTAKIDTLDFASVAATNKTAIKAEEKPGPGSFIGLTNNDAFSNFLKAKNTTSEDVNANADDSGAAGDGVDDENYDPYYEPIVPLPKEIVVSTGEENEEKLFSHGGTLFRHDSETKEWKERGVGEIKILKHVERACYRLLLRREKIHKLVLNFPINVDFKFSNMNNSTKSFLFVGMNYAEATEGEYEKLAIRFKKEDVAAEFRNHLNKCIEDVQSRASEQTAN